MLDLDLLKGCTCSLLITSTICTNTAFLIPHFFKERLIAGACVLLVTVDNEAGHFFKVMKKMSIHLSQYIESEHLRILDLLSAQKHAEMGHSLAFHFEHLLREIINQLEPWTKRKSQQDIVVIIESLSTLYALTEHPEELASFCRYCVNLGSVQSGNRSEQDDKVSLRI